MTLRPLRRRTWRYAAAICAVVMTLAIVWSIIAHKEARRQADTWHQNEYAADREHARDAANAKLRAVQEILDETKQLKAALEDEKARLETTMKKTREGTLSPEEAARQRWVVEAKLEQLDAMDSDLDVRQRNFLGG